ncbi:bifunctional adenosylcobinamide kinase/adenosylcobinamide-phosphate guanylyltransferase [Magnetococcales bacterium HHB-1]
MRAELILGGRRSGKSAYAEKRALQRGLEVAFIATAQVQDEEMRVRVQAHQQQRSADWLLLEEPFFLSQALQSLAQRERVILVDCLTLWLSNWLFQSKTISGTFAEEREAFLSQLKKLPGEIILVSNEISLGVVPLGEATRNYLDLLGLLHQEIAEHCWCVSLVTAGLPLKLKEE